MRTRSTQVACSRKCSRAFRMSLRRGVTKGYCLKCSKPLSGDERQKGPKRKYCSYKCRRNASNQRARERRRSASPKKLPKRYLYSCDYCYEQFITAAKKRHPEEPRFCNGSCAQRYRHESKPKKIVEAQPYVVDPTEHLGLVCKIANEHRGFDQRNQPIEDLEQYGDGLEGLLLACQRFDPDSGTKFSSYASKCIRGAILNNIRDRKKYSIQAQKLEFLDGVADSETIPRDYGEFGNWQTWD